MVRYGAFFQCGCVKIFNSRIKDLPSDNGSISQPVRENDLNHIWQLTSENMRCYNQTDTIFKQGIL
jgi:hypothetical protein